MLANANYAYEFNPALLSNVTYEYAPTPPSDMLRDVDPDEQFFNDIFPTYRDDTHSPYYSLERYNNEFRSVSFSFNVLHMNVRSLNANGDLFNSFLNALYKTLDVSVMSKTWLAEVSLELGIFDGYNSFHVVMMPEEAEYLCV